MFLNNILICLEKKDEQKLYFIPLYGLGSGVRSSSGVWDRAPPKKDCKFFNAKETISSAALNQNVAYFCKVPDGGELGSGDGEIPTNFSF